MYGGPYGAMAAPDFEQGGAMGAKAPFTTPRKRPMNLAIFVTAVFVPLLIFASVFSLCGFSLHYSDESTCKALVFAVLFIVLLIGWMAGGAWRRYGEGVQDPKWYTFVFVTGLLAWIFGFVFGNDNFDTNIRPYLDIVNLNVYPDIDPAVSRGQQLMDAGRIIFTEGTHLDLSISMGFKNLDTYCVAPISSRPANKSVAAAPIYDFWAVGMNCCSGHSPDFRCGEYDNPRARSGLRLMKDDQRAYFRLAVQQAEAAYNIHAPHPIFLYWMQDPMSEVNAYQDAGYVAWLLGIGLCGGAQFVLTVIATVVFAKFGL